ncbi:MAG: hypothetical protein AB1490_01805 [Pseudomonadota bacterium]
MTVKSETNRRENRTWMRACMGVLMGAAIVIGSTGTVFIASTSAVYAADDDDEDLAPDTKFFRGLLKGLGLKRDGEGSGIDYRERSPLVLPNGKNLPAPETEPVTAKNPAWPLDVDVKRSREAKSRRAKENVSAAGNETDRPERPDQLNGPGRGGAGAPTTPVPGGQAEAADRPMSPVALGVPQGFFKPLWAPKEEYATFTGEPGRGKLTEPPAGYRTPSAAQPYGIGKEKWVAPKANTADRSNDIR